MEKSVCLKANELIKRKWGSEKVNEEKGRPLSNLMNSFENT